jgi:hypothetical protein
MTERVEYSVDISDAERELDRLIRGPSGETTLRLESVLARSYAATQFQVHVMTGKLKASGHPESSFTGDVWTGTLVYDRHPGIFELARGDSPTLNHPEGGHFFFDPAHKMVSEYGRVMADWLEDRI